MLITACDADSRRANTNFSLFSKILSMSGRGESICNLKYDYCPLSAYCASYAGKSDTAPFQVQGASHASEKSKRRPQCYNGKVLPDNPGLLLCSLVSKRWSCGRFVSTKLSKRA